MTGDRQAGLEWGAEPIVGNTGWLGSPYLAFSLAGRRCGNYQTPYWLVRRGVVAAVSAKVQED